MDHPGVGLGVRHRPPQHHELVRGASATPGKYMRCLQVPKRPTPGVFATRVDDEAPIAHAVGDSCEASRELSTVTEMARSVSVSRTDCEMT